MTPAQRSAKNARGILLRALEKATDAIQCYDAMQGYCIAALQLPPGAVTAKELRNFKTARLSPQELSDLADVLEKCELARYAGQCDDLDNLKQSIRKAAK